MDTKFSSGDCEQIENSIPNLVPKLRKILEEQHKIFVPAHCNELIARCIRMKDGDLEKAIKLVKAYRIATENFPSWDATFQPSGEPECFKGGIMAVISQRDFEGRMVYIGRTGMWQTDITTFDQAMANTWMLLQYITAQSKNAQRNGFVTVWDFTGFSIKHVFATNKWRVPYLAKIIQNGVGGRIKEFHAINHSKIFSTLYSTVIKPFLKDKLKKRIIFHDCIESLHSHIDKNGLPTFAGGKKEFEECIDWDFMNEFIGQDQYFMDMLIDRFPRY